MYIRISIRMLIWRGTSTFTLAAALTLSATFSATFSAFTLLATFAFAATASQSLEVQFEDFVLIRPGRVVGNGRPHPRHQHEGKHKQNFQTSHFIMV